MASLFTVPLRNDLPFYKFKINLSGSFYTLQIRYNGRMQRYIMDLNDASGNQIMSGIPILIERNLFGQYAELSLPAGIFFATDDTGQDTQPTQYSFGIDHTLYYEDPTQ